MSRSAFAVSLLAVLGMSAMLVGQPPAGGGGRPWLGVAVAPTNESGEGIVIREVTPDSPAAKAGFKDGDVVLKVDGKDVKEVTDFLRRVGTHKPGDKVDVQIQRDGKDKTVSATLGQRPAQVPGGGAPPLPGDLKGLLRPAFLGVTVEPLDAEARKRLNVKAESGVVVMEVVPNSPAAKAGLRQDDVIVSINGQAIKGPDELRTAVQKDAGKDIMVRIQRGAEQKDLKASLTGGGLERLIPGGPGGPGGIRPPFDIESLTDSQGKIRDLERRVNELEKRLKALETKESKK